LPACLLLALALGLLATAPTALAHGGDESQEGYLLVQQALGHLAHDTSHTGLDLAMEKVDDALAAQDHDGVSIPELTQAKAALEARQVEPARSLLQDSIKGALSELPPATGSDTGTTLILPELRGRNDLSGLDWLLLAGSVVLVAAGLTLSFMFRPQDSVGALRRRLDGLGVSAGENGRDQIKADGSL
jgi:hypothetical protein